MSDDFWSRNGTISDLQRITPIASDIKGFQQGGSWFSRFGNLAGLVKSIMSFF